MSATFIIDEKTGKAYARVLLSSERASTFHSDHIMLDKAAAVAEANSLVRDAYYPSLHFECIDRHAPRPKGTGLADGLSSDRHLARRRHEQTQLVPTVSI